MRVLLLLLIGLLASAACSPPEGPPALEACVHVEGVLGRPLGTFLTLRGVRKHGKGALDRTLLVTSVDGEPLAEAVPIWIENTASLPDQGEYVLRGYESGAMNGLPIAVASAESLTPSKAGFRFRHFFVITSAVQPPWIGPRPYEGEPAPREELLPPDWIRHENRSFSFVGPATLELQRRHGIDSHIGTYADERFRMDFDYGTAALDEPPEIPVRDLVFVDGRAVQVVLFTDETHHEGFPFRYLAMVRVGRSHSLRVNVFFTDERDEYPARCLVSSIRFASRR